MPGSKLFAEVWTRPGDANYGRVVDDPAALSGSFHAGLNQIGDGTLDLSNQSTIFDQILKTDPLTPANSASSTVKIWSEADLTKPIFEWFPNQLYPTTQKNDPRVKVSGLGLNSLPAHARLEPYDWDGTDDFVPNQPDWEWGADNKLGNPGFEDSQVTPKQFQLAITATGGTYTLTDGTDTTSAIAFDAEASTVSTRIQTDLGDYDDVVVVQNGTSPRSFLITMVTPAFGNTLAVNTGSLTGGSAEISVTEEGGQNPTPWTRAASLARGTPQNEAAYTQFVVSPAQNHTPGGTYSLLIDNAGYTATSGRNPGAQQVVSVTPGVTQVSLWVYPTSATDRFRLGVYTLGEEFVGASSISGTTLTANTWNQLTISDLLIPDGLSQVVMRIQVTNPGPYNPAPFYVDDGEFYAGFAPTTVGEILRMIYEHAIDVTLRDPIVWDDGSGTDTPYLTLDFSDTLDSAGQAWADPEIATRLTMRQSYSQIMAHFARDYGYEYRIVADDPETGTYLWQVYNPGTMRVGYTAAQTPGIQGGANDVRRNVNRFLPSGTDVLVEGLGRVTARARNTDLMTALGRIESARIDREVPDLSGAAEAADESLSSTRSNARSLNYTLVDPPDEPMTAYTIGDLLVVDDPPDVLGEESRFVDLTCSFTPNSVEWETQFGSARIINPDAAVANAVSGLLAKFEYPEIEQVPFAGIGGGGGGAFTVQVAAANASEISKDKADFVCAGTADDQTIMAAHDLIASQSSVGGRIVLSEGTFSINTNSIELDVHIDLIGSGIEATQIQTSNTSGVMIVSGGAATISDFILVGFSFSSTDWGIAADQSLGGDHVNVERVFFSGMKAAIAVGNYWHITQCHSTLVPIFVDATKETSHGYNDVSIIDNWRCGLIRSDSTGDNVTGWKIIGNSLGNQIDLTNTDGFVVASNSWLIDPSGNNAALMTVTDCNVGSIANNTGSDIGYYDVLRASGSIGIVLADNTFDGVFGGFYLGTCSWWGIHNNTLGAGTTENYLSTDGVVLTDSSNNKVHDNLIRQPGQDDINTHDGIRLEGDSNDNTVHSNTIEPSQATETTRYGINIADSTCDNNAVFANFLGDSSDYGTADSVDSGTGTIKAASGGAIGGQFAY